MSVIGTATTGQEMPKERLKNSKRTEKYRAKNIKWSPEGEARLIVHDQLWRDSGGAEKNSNKTRDL